VGRRRRPAGIPDGDDTRSGIAERATNGVVRDHKGSLAGSALTMALAARNFLQMVPMASPWTLARAAASNPAALLGAAGERFGALAVGKQAAFTLLGDDGSVCCVR